MSPLWRYCEIQNNAERSSSYKDLSEDRFASHVIQTLLVLGGGETAEREASVLHTLNAPLLTV